MTKYSIAVDIGASSGRLILGYLKNGLLKLEEIPLLVIIQVKHQHRKN